MQRCVGTTVCVCVCVCENSLLERKRDGESSADRRGTLHVTPCDSRHNMAVTRDALKPQMGPNKSSNVVQLFSLVFFSVWQNRFCTTYIRTSVASWTRKIPAPQITPCGGGGCCQCIKIDNFFILPELVLKSKWNTDHILLCKNVF